MSEPSTSHTPPNPKPKAPSILFLREWIKMLFAHASVYKNPKSKKGLTKIFTLKRRASRSGSKSPRSSITLTGKGCTYLD
jgi:hypothetical protein